MPTASIWLIRTALICLIIGAAVGALFLGVPGTGSASLWRVHAEVMLVGWVVQLALGVAYWMLPKHASGAERGAPLVPWLTYAGLNGGVLIVAVAELEELSGGMVATGRALELVAIVLFAATALPRIKAFGAGRI